MEVIFLTYYNRSGSTFLANELSKDKKICVCPEAEILINLFLDNPLKEFMGESFDLTINKLYNDTKFSSWKISKTIFIEHFKNNIPKNNIAFFISILELYKNTIKPNSGYVIFKGTRLNFLIPTLSKINDFSFKTIHIVRDGRAAFASQKRSIGSDTGRPMSKNPVYASSLWNKMMIHSEYNLNQFTNKYYVIKYEHLMNRFREEMESLYSFLHLEKEIENETNTELINNIPENQKHLHERVSKQPDPSRIHKWKLELSKVDVIVFEFIAKESLLQNGYQVLDLKMFNPIIYLMLFYFKLSLFTDRMMNKYKKWIIKKNR